MEKITKHSPAPFSEPEFEIIKTHLLRNIATEKNVFVKNIDGKILQSIPGAVIAAPASQGLNFTQDYLFHWTRDGAITMSAVLSLYLRAKTLAEKDSLRPYLLNYMNFLKITQSQPAYNQQHILGEPKFNIDGTLWTGPWGRPQDDGAGLVSIVLVQLAKVFLEEKQEIALIEALYHRANTCLIKPNLEYIANNWGETAFGPWEEVKGSHFFRLCVQRRALHEGAELANQLGDSKAGLFYIAQAKRLEAFMMQHWTEETGYYREVLTDADYRGGGLDVTVVMGLVYGHMMKVGDAFSVAHLRSFSTAYFVRNCFENLYKINLKLKRTTGYGPLIGRYQNDYYDGDQCLYGNPWFITTNNCAEFYYLAARALLQGGMIECLFMNTEFYKQVLSDVPLILNGVISPQQNPELFETIIGGLIQSGDKMLAAIKTFACTYEDGSILHMSEQIDRQSGQQKSAADLTWSYASTISALLARESTMKFWQSL